MSRFDRVYLDEVIEASEPSPAYTAWIEENADPILELRRQYETDLDGARERLWEWFEQTNPSLGKRSKAILDELADKLATELDGQPWRVRNVGRTVVDGCVGQHQEGKSPLHVLHLGWPRDPAEVPLCLAGPNHLSRRTHAER